jgi:hypothetical protein
VDGTNTDDDPVALAARTDITRTCPRCATVFDMPDRGRGRRPVWCSPACRRLASAERVAARNAGSAVTVVEVPRAHRPDPDGAVSTAAGHAGAPLRPRHPARRTARGHGGLRRLDRRPARPEHAAASAVDGGLHAGRRASADSSSAFFFATPFSVAVISRHLPRQAGPAGPARQARNTVHRTVPRCGRGGHRASSGQ